LNLQTALPCGIFYLNRVTLYNVRYGHRLFATAKHVNSYSEIIFL